MSSPILTPLYTPKAGEPMRIVALMSGSGSNLVKIIEAQKQLEEERGKENLPFRVVGITTDNPQSKAADIGSANGIVFWKRSMEKFYEEQECDDLRNMEVRAAYDEVTAGFARKWGADVIAYAGYMRIATPVLINAALGVNVHPGDLRVVGADGRRLYTGDYAVGKAINKYGATELHAVTHVITEGVDAGPLLMVSDPLAVELPDGYDPGLTDKILRRQIADAHQDRLKKRGDWRIFPETLLHIAEGRYARDEAGALYFDRKAIPNGVNIGDIR